MTDLQKSQVKVDDLVERCDVLRSDIMQWLADVNGAASIEELERLQEAIEKNVSIIELKVETLNKPPRPKIGDGVPIYRVESGDVVTGTVVADDGVELKVKVPEVIIPPVPQQTLPSYTTTVSLEEDFESGWRWIDHSFEDFSDHTDRTDVTS